MSLPDEPTLRTLVDRACRAPSVHNTQPWLWRAAGDRIELFADTRRKLQYADASGRDLVVSCGAALNHFETAAAGAGWATEVRRLPDPKDQTRLASVTLSPAAPSPDQVRLATAIDHRHTDRRQVSSWAVPAGRLEELGQLAVSRGVLSTVHVDDRQSRVIHDALLEATRVQHSNDAYLDELLAWTHVRGAEGVPTSSLLTRTASAKLPGSFTRFPTGSLEDDHHESSSPDASWIVLSTSSDDTLSWLRTGEALSAIWLSCTVGGLTLVPYSQPVEVQTTRAQLQHDVLAGTSCPQLLLRVGWPPLDRLPVPGTPRRPVERVLEVRGWKGEAGAPKATPVSNHGSYAHPA
jgi:hypothetical protein